MAHIKSTGKYIMTYELCGTNEGDCPAHYKVVSSPNEGDCPVHYKVVSSPLEFNAVQGVKISTRAGESPGSAPYIIWTEHPNKSDG